MDKSRVCINQAKQMAKQRPCVKKTNVLVYDKNKSETCSPDVIPGAYSFPPIATVSAKKIRVCTGAELRKMCAPKLCECPPLQTERKKIGVIGKMGSVIGFGVKLVIAGGLIYWTYDMGLWGESSQTEEIYLGICETFTPLFHYCKPKWRRITEICEEEIQLMCKPPPREVDGVCRKAPSTEIATQHMKEKWNRFVVCTFDVLTDIPSYAVGVFNKVKGRTGENSKFEKEKQESKMREKRRQEEECED